MRSLTIECVLLWPAGNSAKLAIRYLSYIQALHSALLRMRTYGSAGGGRQPASNNTVQVGLFVGELRVQELVKMAGLDFGDGLGLEIKKNHQTENTMLGGNGS